MSTESKEILVGESSQAKPEKKTIVLMASDGDEFVVDVDDITNQSEMIRNLISDMGGTDGLQVPLLNVTAPVLAKLLELFNVSNKNDDDEEVTQKVKELMEAELNMMIDVLGAANYIEATSFFDLSCKVLADKFKGMSVEEVREFLNIECDFTEEELQQIHAENAWAFD
ncbi:hypothetical protein C4D60_Mb11t05540 [Musa balbisiana]|uniref:SKP1-like protein n=1 Tax=Musa balbisiana TaxID=52838 RepID=A0A4S8J1X6_MUSBA|nr:hypothetical protein C4D60_Mb11t05540 [Musa balbisiana]